MERAELRLKLLDRLYQPGKTTDQNMAEMKFYEKFILEKEEVEKLLPEPVKEEKKSPPRSRKNADKLYQ